MYGQFFVEIKKLRLAGEQFAAGLIKSVQYSNVRGASLGASLLELAKNHGVDLRGPMFIDSRGEFSVIANPSNDGNAPGSCGSFGQEFSALLNQYRPRTGITAGAVLVAESSWCWMNHFDVEKMVCAAADKLKD